MSKRVFLIVLDSCGIGEMPDAPLFGDHDCHTLKRISGSPEFRFESMKKMGVGNIDGQDYLPAEPEPLAAVCRIAERSMGKDTTIGHWEIAGVVSPSPLPTYPNGFPREVLDEFEKATGRGVLCNLPYSGTDVIRDYGEEHIKTGKLIVYTSADSVFQIAAHEDHVPLEELYECCRKARKILCGKHAVGRVIARPFVGEPGNFTRTSNRHDFSLEPPRKTLLDALKEEGKTVYAIGKINDIFAGRGITEKVYTHGNTEGMALTLDALDRDFEGLCFTNLVDFDMLYGHRQNVDGYAAAFAEFDRWLPSFTEKMRDDDILFITADHGCDPGDSHTDHTREHIPLVVYGKSVAPVNLGTRRGFCDIAATIADYLGSGYRGEGTSFLPLVKRPDETEKALCRAAFEAMRKAYIPYSGYSVGAAALTGSGKIYSGCNIENASFTPTVCAERTAIFKAVSEGERVFKAIAVCGGKGFEVRDVFPPCGVCRQVMAEFFPKDAPVLLMTGEDTFERHTLAELLPFSFDPGYMET
ncbi:MAG: phosphopentomutase [Clostridia bacterium]|nr:phosphopentomutase [Clostridia bacterium]